VTILTIALTVVVVVQAVLLAGLLRSHADILRRLHDLGAGLDPDRDPAASPSAAGTDDRPRVAPGVVAPGPTPAEGRQAPDLLGAAPSGETRALRVAGVEHDTALVFLSSTCAGCAPYWQELADPGVPAGTRVVIVAREEPDEDAAAIAELAPPGIDVVLSSAAFDELEVPGSPYVVLVDGATGRVRGEGTAGSWPAVRTLLLRGTATAGSPRAKAAADARRERDADRHLLAAGISPGDASLYRRADGTEVEQP
jgi:hypothetical protein